MRQAVQRYTETLPECADSIESHPYLDGLFALATYQVDQQEVDRELGKVDPGDETAAEESSSSPPYTRTGRVRLYQTRGGTEQEPFACDLQVEIHTPAILDTKWSLASLPDVAAQGSSSRGILGVADATGHLSLHGLRGGSTALHPIASWPLNPTKALCLSLDWSDRKAHYPSSCAEASVSREPISDSSVVVSQSDGSIAYISSIRSALTGDASHLLSRESPDEGSDDDDEQATSDDEQDDTSSPPTDWPDRPLALEVWHAHDHEAWIAAFDTFSQGRVIWSGGDDLALKGWDVRTRLSSHSKTRSPTFASRRGFDGGVTTLQSHWSREGLWAVGSYDSKLRLFDAKMPLRPLTTLELPGGIWRLKWHPEDPSLLLAGCMHGGFAIVSVPWLKGEGSKDNTSSELEIVSTFEGHDSLAYGCDWDRGTMSAETGSSRLVYSCSFYDKKLCAWES